MLAIEQRPEFGKIVLKLRGDLDFSSIDQFETILMSSPLHDYKIVIFDLTGISFIDSTGIGTMISVLNRLEEQGIECALSNISDSIDEVLDILGLKGTLRII